MTHADTEQPTFVTEERPGPRSRRRRAAVVVLVVAVCGSAGAAALWERSADEPDRGPDLVSRETRPAPDFSVADLRDPAATVSLAQFRGRPVVVNFWASWCPPCLREMPEFEKVRQRLGSRVAFVGMNHLDRRDAGLRLLEQTGVGYPSGFDPEGGVAARFELFGMPTTVFVDRSGTVVGTRTGEMGRAELESTIDELFGE